MADLEIPLHKRSLAYRLFEMLPAVVSYGAIILLVVLSLLSPLLAAVYLLLVAVTVFIKAIVIAYHMIRGRKKLHQAENIPWRQLLDELEHPDEPSVIAETGRNVPFYQQHRENLRRVASSPIDFPRPSTLYNAVIIATYNEPYEVLEGTLTTLAETTYDNRHLIVLLAYEERGGEATERTAARLAKKFSDIFYRFETVKHPKNLPNEVIGKGGNITYAGRFLQKLLEKHQISPSNVIVTTLDSDNKTHPAYFDYVTYEYILHEDRKRLSYQPISLFLNNIWDVPAPMRVVATGNSFWNIISAMRPHTLRNFASHSQPMDALMEMDFWSTRTIVEDGHQYWRSYFHFKGDYDVVPIFVPIYQDAVMSDTYVKTLKAQFVQLRRWAYGASDVPYVGTRVFTRKQSVPFWAGLARFARLLDGHVTLACIPLLVTFGGWVPLLINYQATQSVAANQLPEVLGVIQRIAMVGLVITVFLAFKMLPPRPARYRRRRTIGMLLQWVLMPVTALCYSATSAYYSQTRLFLGKYMTKFDVTEKATAVSVEKAKQRRKRTRLSQKILK